MMSQKPLEVTVLGVNLSREIHAALELWIEEQGIEFVVTALDNIVGQRHLSAVRDKKPKEEIRTLNRQANAVYNLVRKLRVS